MKMYHVMQEVLEDLLTSLNKEFGKEAPLMVTWGETHNYLGMAIDYTIPGKVKITMLDFVQGVLDECPEDLMKGPSSTHAANHLFNVDPESKNLGNEKASRFHHLTAKLLYLSKHARPDLQTAVSFLTTRVCELDEDDYKKLGRCLQYLQDNNNIPVTYFGNK